MPGIRPAAAAEERLQVLYEHKDDLIVAQHYQLQVTPLTCICMGVAHCSCRYCGRGPVQVWVVGVALYR